MSESGQRRKLQAIAALLQHPTIERAAKSAGIGSSTLRRWLGEPEFAAEYQRARRQVVGQAVAHLQKTCGLAVSALEIVLRHSKSSGARVRAAEIVLQQTFKAQETEELAKRVEALEAQIETPKKDRRIA